MLRARYSLSKIIHSTVLFAKLLALELFPRRRILLWR